MKKDKCLHCNEIFEISLLWPRPESSLGYRRICKPCYRKRANEQARIKRNNMTPQQRRALKKIWDRSNKKRALERKEVVRKKHAEDFLKKKRVCATCLETKKKEEFRFYWSKAVGLHKYRRSCEACLSQKRKNKEKTDRGTYTNYKHDAKRKGRNYSFIIPFEEFSALLNSACHYCGTSPSRGVDRFDNAIGYESGNCVPCCSMCNEMKMDHSVEKWMSHIKQIIKYSGDCSGS